MPTTCFTQLLYSYGIFYSNWSLTLLKHLIISRLHFFPELPNFWILFLILRFVVKKELTYFHLFCWNLKRRTCTNNELLIETYSGKNLSISDPQWNDVLLFLEFHLSQNSFSLPGNIANNILSIVTFFYIIIISLCRTLFSRYYDQSLLGKSRQERRTIE